MQSLYNIDEFGRAVVDADGLFELWFRDQSEQGIVISSGQEIDEYNHQCLLRDKLTFILKLDDNKPVPLSARTSQWLIPEEYNNLDVAEWCLSLCSTDKERDRVNHEMRLFKERDMFPVLRAMIYMVNVFRENKIVWGIGRGSSVASYALFLIGIHRIDSIRYDLEVEDFLR